MRRTAAAYCAHPARRAGALRYGHRRRSRCPPFPAARRRDSQISEGFRPAAGRFRRLSARAVFERPGRAPRRSRDGTAADPRRRHDPRRRAAGADRQPALRQSRLFQRARSGRIEHLHRQSRCRGRRSRPGPSRKRPGLSRRNRQTAAAAGAGRRCASFRRGNGRRDPCPDRPHRAYAARRRSRVAGRRSGGELDSE
ncbi:hypothetical protein SDC9_168751 [bioreactor metagenome]|uniref:Uncharacterized protein n=1 Tax=bioreactor metagenome TaxID=1076179 RepID=A0A645G5X3_9ZZZZ